MCTKERLRSGGSALGQVAFSYHRWRSFLRQGETPLICNETSISNDCVETRVEASEKQAVVFAVENHHPEKNGGGRVEMTKRCTFP